MKKNLLTLALTSIVSASALATIDSYTTIQIPVHGMQESPVCLVKTLAWDGVSGPGTAQLLAANALNGPLKIPAIQAGEDSEGLVQVNMLHQSGVKVAIDVNMDTFNKASITIDTTEAALKAKTVEEKAEVVRLAKIALYSAVANTVDSMIKTATVQVKGLPDQRGIKSPIPAVFKSSFTKTSPYLASIKKELGIVDANQKCI